MTKQVAPDFAASCVEALNTLRNDVRALAMSAYMKDRFAFLGIPTPERRQAVRALIREYRGDPIAAATLLWQRPEREFQYVANDLLRHHARRLDAAALPALEMLVVQKAWWDTVDSLAVTIGAIVLRQPSPGARMDELIRDENMWLRRIALLHQLGWKDQTDEPRLFAYCLQCSGEKEFFIRKAIGWALRQYARVAPAAVADFLCSNRHRLSPLSVREASRHLPADI